MNINARFDFILLLFFCLFVFIPSDQKECDSVEYILMGCCRKDNKKTKNKSDLTKKIKTNKTENKKSLTDDVSYCLTRFY